MRTTRRGPRPAPATEVARPRSGRPPPSAAQRPPATVRQPSTWARRNLRFFAGCFRSREDSQPAASCLPRGATERRVRLGNPAKPPISRGTMDRMARIDSPYLLIQCIKSICFIRQRLLIFAPFSTHPSNLSTSEEASCPLSTPRSSRSRSTPSTTASSSKSPTRA
ncbi:hypothetical protein STPYR_11865 [uncultured Stenotrophomonas sp.]|uniref:Uncharacterized protein n=1 Tax=uncultured Stenotrophomonas sp. TaxID=165438 RepID=A0A1Y5Q7X7_9GAMM|nr:hypothetical protein STPYR_11865 [uncultured Stenotrophomonas sp.]